MQGPMLGEPISKLIGKMAFVPGDVLKSVWGPSCCSKLSSSLNDVSYSLGTSAGSKGVTARGDTQGCLAV